MYKTSCLCGIMSRDKYLDLYMRLYGMWTELSICVESESPAANIHFNIGDMILCVCMPR